MSEHPPNPGPETQVGVQAEKPTSYKAFSNSAYVAAADLGSRRVTKTISAVDTIEFIDEDGKTDVKELVTFSDAKKQFVANKTNQGLLESLFGDNPQNAVGHKITLAAELDRVGTTMQPCVRIVGSPELPEAEREVKIKLKMKNRTRTVVRKLVRT